MRVNTSSQLKDKPRPPAASSSSSSPVPAHHFHPLSLSHTHAALSIKEGLSRNKLNEMKNRDESNRQSNPLPCAL